MAAPSIDVGGRGAGVASFELRGALQAARNLGILAQSLPGMQKLAIGTLRRRLPVEARRDIQREYAVPAARIRRDLSISETPTGLRLRGHFRGIGLRNFAARQTRAGVTSAIFLGRRSLDAGAFFAPLLGGNLQVVERFSAKRVMTKGRYAGKRRQPIQTLYGPTVAQMLRKGRRPERLADFSRGVLQDEIERLIEYYTGGKPIPGATN